MMGRTIRFISQDYPQWYRKFRMSVSRKARLIRQRLEDFSEANLNIKSMPAFKRKAAAVNNTMETGALCFGVENVCDLLASKRYAVRSIFLELGKCTKEDEELLLKINKIARQYDADVNVVGCSRANASAHSSAHEGVYARLVPVRFDGLPVAPCDDVETNAEVDQHSAQMRNGTGLRCCSNKNT